MSDVLASVTAAAARVEAGDPDRFAAVMASPAAQRAALWPLYAANLEIARAPWASAEPVVAEMRLQWWVDALEELAASGRAPAHEIGPALVDLRDQAGLLVAVAEARRWDCWREPFADRAAFETYLDQTAGNLYWAAARALGAGPEAERAVRDHAFAAGLATWFAAVPALESQGRMPLPDGRPEAVADLARTALVRVQGVLLSGPAALALLPGWQARAMLKRAAQDPARVAQGALAGSEFARRAGLLWRAAFLR
ncbi:MAG: squalene/phytoene synthase family protein [Paracoccaceae bacterium]|nr:squalene/phytoene synthase family protein [Paracoccaceae bacterium]